MEILELMCVPKIITAIPTRPTGPTSTTMRAIETIIVTGAERIKVASWKNPYTAKASMVAVLTIFPVFKYPLAVDFIVRILFSTRAWQAAADLKATVLS